MDCGDGVKCHSDYRLNLDTINGKEFNNKYIKPSMIDGEIWKDVIGYESEYAISNTGRLLSKGRKVSSNMDGFDFMKTVVEKIKRPCLQDGYLRIGLSKNKNTICRLIHTLVAIHFVPNPYNKEQVNHEDGNKLNNNDWNLKWATQLENIKHAYDTGLMRPRSGIDSHCSKLTNEEVLSIRQKYNSISLCKLAKMFNVSKPTISNIVNRKTWKHI